MYRLASILILFASVVGASGQQADPSPVLARARERLLRDVLRLPRYVCVQTINRRYYATPFRQPPNSCKEVITEHDKRTHELTLYGSDRLRLNVAVAGSSEIYSWVGAPKLGEATLAEIARKGPLGSGDFGPFITAIFTVATIKFEREHVIDGRRLLEYFYDVPRTVSNYDILHVKSKKSVTTGYSGTFLLDPADFDLIRLAVRTAELPPETNWCQAISEVDYGRVLIHDSQTLLPRETRLRTLGRQGEEALVTTSYADCHEYSSKSVLRFEPAEITESAAQSPSSGSQNHIPAGLHFDLRVITPIDSDTAAAGDPLDAVARSQIRDKKGAILAAAGTHLHGRLVQVEHLSPPGSVVKIAMEFDSIDIKGESIPIGVVLDAQNASSVYMGALRTGDMASANGHFLYVGDHLKVSHLDTKATTTSLDKKN